MRGIHLQQSAMLEQTTYEQTRQPPKSDSPHADSRREIYPHLAKLVCSGQPTVRVALGDLMGSQLPPLMAVARP
jgi:hypothetical protein